MMSTFHINRATASEAKLAAKPYQVLIIDDEEANLRVMQSCLQEDFEVLLANNGQQALEIVGNLATPHNLACIISDQRMPGLTGADFLQQSIALAPHCIRIIVSGFSDLEAIISSINKAEVFRFISKPYDQAELLQLVQTAVQVFESKIQAQHYYLELESKIEQYTKDLERKNGELNQVRESLQQCSLTDPLTQMRNRRYLQQRMDADVSITIRRYEEWLKRGCPGMLLDVDLVFFYADLDHFKQFNQQYGQAAGDCVLQQMPGRLQEVFRDSDYLVRWDDEEFLVVARATNRSEAGIIAERIRSAVANRHFQLDDERSAALTCSIGFAPFPFASHAPRAISWNQVIDLAEHAMLMAKEEGRNAWQGIYATEQTKVEDLIQFVRRDCATAIQMGQVQVLKNLPASDR